MSIVSVLCSFQLKDFDIEVIGGPSWTEFSSIKLRYYHELNLIFYSSFWVDYLNPEIDSYMADFRNQFYNEPKSTTRKGINYGIIGYDMTFYFTNALRLYGSRFMLSLSDYQPDLVQKVISRQPATFHEVVKLANAEQLTARKFSLHGGGCRKGGDSSGNGCGHV